MRRLPRAEWSIVIRDHHPGFIDWETFEANQVLALAKSAARHIHTSFEFSMRDRAYLERALLRRLWPLT